MRNATVPILVALMMLISALPLLATDASGAETQRWTQSADADFNGGTLDDLVVSGSGDAAQLQLATASS